MKNSTRHNASSKRRVKTRLNELRVHGTCPFRTQNIHRISRRTLRRPRIARILTMKHKILASRISLRRTLAGRPHRLISRVYQPPKSREATGQQGHTRHTPTVTTKDGFSQNRQSIKRPPARPRIPKRRDRIDQAIHKHKKLRAPSIPKNIHARLAANGGHSRHKERFQVNIRTRRHINFERKLYRLFTMTFNRTTSYSGLSK